ncbi:MAG TPA: TonB-dependent receptor, partial [Vicinamibacterales bacterium]
AIYNRTLPERGPGNTILRRRSNGDARAVGGEVELDARPRDGVAVWTSFTTGRSRFTSGQLDGNQLPQVPRAQGAAGIRLTGGRWMASLDARYWARQFDDDANEIELEAATVFNALVSARFRRAQLFASVENLFDTEVDAGRTPLRTLGQPRMWQIGVRVFTR